MSKIPNNMIYKWFFFIVANTLIVVHGCFQGEPNISSQPELPVSLERQKIIFQNNSLTANNIEYIGCGYDMYNQSGTDESTGFSLKNYRAPVLDNYTLGVNKDNDSYDKMGIWLSNEFVCDVSYERTVVDTKQKLKTIMLSSKSEGGSGIFKSNHKTVNTRDDIYNKLKKSRNVLVRKYRCTVYSAGIIYNNPR